MVELLPISFPVPTEPAIASYNYTDVAEGTGVIIFDGYNTEDNAGTITTRLSSNPISSATIESSFTAGVGTLNYDLTVFNSPRTIKGTATVALSAIAVGGTATMRAYIKKVAVGGAVTSLGDNTGGVITLTPKHDVINIPLTQTHFAKGDTLRLTLTSTYVTDCIIGNDPLNRNGASVTPSSTFPTTLKIAIPFKLDL